MTYFAMLLCAFNLMVTIQLVTSTDPIFEDTLELYRKACPQSQCGSGVISIPVDGTYSSNSGLPMQKCCGRCSCDDDCYLHGSCCLIKYDDFYQGRHYVDNTRYSCTTPEFVARPPKNYTSPLPYWMITQCEHGEDNAIIEKCENAQIFSSFEYQIPVSDLITGVLYRNIFCAQCSGVVNSTNLLSWDISLECDGTPQLQAGNIIDQMRDHNCSAVFKPLNNIAVQKRGMSPKLGVLCHAFTYEISTCNETGLWPVYNATTDIACNSFIDPFNRTYKNYFCYLCNVERPIDIDKHVCRASEDNINRFTPSFNAVLDINTIKRWDSGDTLACDPGAQFEDYKLMQCRNVTCFETGFYDPVLTFCEVNLRRMDMFCYAVILKLTPTTQQLTISSLTSDVFILSLRWSISYIIPNVDNMLEQIGVLIADADGVVDQDDHVESFVVYLLINTATYQNKSYLGRFTQSPAMYVSGEGMPTYLFSVELWSYGLNGLAAGVISPYATLERLALDNLTTVNSHESGLLSCRMKDIVPFTKIKMCPYITLEVEEIDVMITNDVLIIKEINLNLSKWEYEIHSGSIYMCLDDYEFINKQLQPREMNLRTDVNDLTVDPKGLLALICVCLSLLALLVTIFIYSYFTVLQSQPGVNNLILCICLLLAQSVYQFGAGQTTLPNWACVLIGAISHFLWLTALFSMNICSVHIYLTFSKNRKLSATYDRKQTSIYVAYIVFVPLGFVLINIIVSLIDSHGQDIGYGGSLCYISSNLMQSITFLLPLLVLLISNIVLFVVVVIKINRIKEAVEKTKKERNFLLIYARLSSLTGITWIFGLFQVLIKHDIFEYLFIIFNASQGVFIMIAFVVNKRVASLFCRKKTLDSSTGTIKSIHQYSISQSER